MKLAKVGPWIYIALWIVAVFAALRLLPLQQWSLELSTVAKGLGAIGIVAFSLIFITCTVCLFPCAFLAFAAGVAYGLWGIPLVLGSAVIGATISFFISRHFLKPQVTKWLAKRTDTKAIQLTLEQDGWKAMLLLRLSPVIPFNVNNYFLGTVNVSFVTYLWVMIAGTFPFTALIVYLGSLGRNLNERSPAEIMFVIVGVLATILFLQRVLWTRSKLV